jgi:phage-related protein
MPHNLDEKALTVYFYKTPAGNEPVREWLKQRTSEEKKAIGEDIKAVEFFWPVGYPQVTKLDKDLWEVRTNLPDGICRVFFTVWNPPPKPRTKGSQVEVPLRKQYMVLLHGIIKKSQKTPQQDLDHAKRLRNRVMAGGITNEE